MSDDEYNDEVVEDVEIYDDVPEFDRPQANEDGDQDDEIALGGGLTFLARSSSVRDTAGMVEWYKNHMSADQLGFNPDGMCLKVARLSRNIGPGAASARLASEATPMGDRVAHVRDLRKGMFLYFDDIRDNNPFGHIVGMIGRVKNFDPDDLGDVLVVTNSVVSGRLVVVRADYFHDHWGDPFVFGAKSLNGVELPLKKYDSLIEKFNDGGPVYHLNALRRAAQDRPAAKTALDGILRQVNGLPDSPKLVRIREFKDKVRSKEQILDMGLLNEAAAHAAKGGRIQRARDEIRRLIASLPDV